MLSKKIRKYQVEVAMLFIACFFSAFSLKTFHHLEEHGKVFTCEQHDGRHFHESSEGECCPICEFFFSPFFGEIFQQETNVLLLLESIFSNPVTGIEPQFIAFFYSLRAPPL